MSEPEALHTDAPDALSALLDGDTDASQTAQLCRQWRSDPELRRDWHAYHLIGDVLRSGDLATPSARDEQFLQGLRARLAQEPVVLAPLPKPAEPSPAAKDTGQLVALPLERGRRLRRWVAPVGIAAGVVVVTSAVLVLRPLDPAGAGSTLAAAPAITSVTLQPTFGSTPATAPPQDSDTLRLDRDTLQQAQLERYLSAHRQFQGSTLLSPSPAYLRSAAYETGVQP